VASNPNRTHLFVNTEDGISILLHNSVSRTTGGDKQAISQKYDVHKERYVRYALVVS